jgi:hypothetical protein
MESRKPKRTKVTAACGGESFLLQVDAGLTRRSVRQEKVTMRVTHGRWYVPPHSSNAADVRVGCHRCRILGTSCSLATSEPFERDSRSPTRDEGSLRNGNGKRPAEQDAEDPWRRLEELETRLRAVEAELGHRRSPSPRSKSQPCLPPPATRTVPAEEESLGRAMVKHPAPYTTVLELLGVDSDGGWYGPVRSGLLSEGQMGGAWLS